MDEATHWPQHIDYAARVFSDDAWDADAYIASFAHRWDGLDIAALERALTAGDNDDRLFAVHGLGYLRTLEAQARLLALLETEPRDSLAYWASGVWLGEIGEQRAVPALCAMLTDFLPTQLDEYIEEGITPYDDWRIGIPGLLGQLGNSSAIPALRQAVWHVVHLLRQSTTFVEAEIVSLSQLPSQRHELSRADVECIHAALSPGRRKYLSADGQPALPKDAVGWVETSQGDPGMLDGLLRYLDDIVHALGRLDAFGALTGLAVPELYLRLWMAHLVMGHLHDRLSALAAELGPTWHSDTLEARLMPLAGPVLQHRFGLGKGEQTQAVTLWVLTKAVETLEILASAERERQRSARA